MRYFPSASRRRLGAALAASSVAIGLVAIPLAHADIATDDLKDRQKRAERQVEQAEHDLEMSSARLVKATKALASARTDLSAARSTLSEVRTDLAAAQAADLRMQAELLQAQQEVSTARTDLEEGRTALETQRDQVADLVSSIYEQGDPDLLAIISVLGAETASDLTRQEEARDIAVGQETSAFDDLSTAEVVLRLRETTLEQAEQAVADKAQAAADHVQVVAGLEADAESAKNDVVALVDARKDAQAESRAAKAADRRKLRKARAEDRRVEAMLRERARRAAARARAQAGPPQNTGGFLNRPVPGIVTSPFGYRVHPIWGYYGLHDGTDFKAACGAPMYAAADGKVIESYYQSAYGNRLIVDHGFQRGVGLATIYNHATSYTVGVGEKVTRGQVIGYVGSTGWSTGCHLHFTVMANGSPVDPAAWF